MKAVDEMTDEERSATDSEAVRAALQLLSDKGYVIYKDGARMVMTGKRTWSWVKP